VLLWAAAKARRRATTDRYAVVMARPPAPAQGPSTIIRGNDAALTLASRASAA
jgi:hypothetical protein